MRANEVNEEIRNAILMWIKIVNVLHTLRMTWLWGRFLLKNNKGGVIELWCNKWLLIYLNCVKKAQKETEYAETLSHRS